MDDDGTMMLAAKRREEKSLRRKLRMRIRVVHINHLHHLVSSFFLTFAMSRLFRAEFLIWVFDGPVDIRLAPSLT